MKDTIQGLYDLNFEDFIFDQKCKEEELIYANLLITAMQSDEWLQRANWAASQRIKKILFFSAEDEIPIFEFPVN